MTRADLLKRLLQSYQIRDDDGFRSAAQEIIAEERKKHHPIVATELQRILENGDHNARVHRIDYDGLPMDSNRNAPLVEIRTPQRYFADLVLDPHLRSELQRILEEFRSWEILDANGLLPTRNVLFSGPPGCGKSVAAEALAAELGLPLLYARFDAVVSSLLGETASNLRKIFNFAEKGQWVILFDEFDAIGRSRDDATEHGEIKRVVNSYLQLIDSFHGRSLIVSATNFDQVIDPALWRRFDDVLRFDKPSESQLRELVSKCLGAVHVQRDLVVNLASALNGATFADAERSCLDIRKACALRGDSTVRHTDIEQAMFLHAYRRSIMNRVPHTMQPTIDKG